MKYSFWNELGHEVRCNQQLKIKIFVILFRIAQLRNQHWLLWIYIFPLHLVYFIYSQFFLGIEIPISCKIGRPFKIWHGVGIVINPSVVIGKNCILRNGVTIGNNGSSNDCPEIGNDVEIGANSVIVGNILIGNGAKIGPCAFVNFDLGENQKVVSLTTGAK